MLHTITFQASVQSFLIWVAEVPRKNSPFYVVLFFSASAPVFRFAVLQSLSLLFLCKLFWAGKRNSSSSWKSLFSVEENYFIRLLTSLISLQWVMYEGSFQVRDGRWWKKIQECQTLKLGDAPDASPSSSTIISLSLVSLYFYHFMRYVLFLERPALYFSRFFLLSLL